MNLHRFEDAVAFKHYILPYLKSCRQIKLRNNRNGFYVKVQYAHYKGTVDLVELIKKFNRNDRGENI